MAKQNQTPWKGTDANERLENSVHNALVAIALDGVSGVSPELPGHGHRQVSPAQADQYLERGRRVLADFESQAMAPGGARGKAQRWMDFKIDELRRLLADAEAVRAGKKPQKMKPEDYEELRKSLGVGEAMGLKEKIMASRKLGFREARRYSTPAAPPRRFVSPMVADFNTLDDLISHAKRELGATHVSYPEPGTMQGISIYFPRKDGQYERANTWEKAGYWHAQGPGNREIIRHLPHNAQCVVPREALVGRSKRTAETTHAGRRATEASRHDASPLSGPRKEERDRAISQAVEKTRQTGTQYSVWMSKDGIFRVDPSSAAPWKDTIATTHPPKGHVSYKRHGVEEVRSAHHKLAEKLIELPVIFRAEKSGDAKGEVTAVFPTLPGTGPNDFTVYAHIGQHSTGSFGWYQQTRAATPTEYASLLAELRHIYEQGQDPVKLRIVERFTRHYDDQRRKESR